LLAAMASERPIGMVEITRKLCLCMFYIIVSATLIRFNKFLMHKDRFPFSLALSAVHMVVSTVCCLVLNLVAPSLMPKMIETRGHRLELMKWFVPIALCFAVMLFGSNEAYMYCNVTFLQFMKEANVMLVFLLSCVVGLQVLNRTRAVVLLWVIAGASISISGELTFSALGFVLQGVSQIAECSRMVMGEIVLSGPRKLDPLTYTMFLAPTCLVVLVIANLFHWDPITWSRMVAWWPQLLANAGVAFLLNVTVATVVKECSAVGFVLTGLIKDIVIVSFSAAFFGEHVTNMQRAAFTITIGGVAFWSMMRITPEAPPVQALERMLCVQHSKADETEEHAPLLSKQTVDDRRKV